MKGLINLESIIILLVYFSLIGIFIASMHNANNIMQTKKDFISARESAVNCSEIADAVYSNSGGEVKIKENCFFEKGKMKSKVNEETAEEDTLTEKLTNSKKGIKIETEEHYK
jgi:hypothetical protein